ncbi:DUF3168 domain-containing protein [Duganella sp. FT135W]|uniref:DUF3168 domain-containing protein n=1 Tax=Duganella flavida TaxID=2692175 RepID=A0A6L8KFI2_9BURK|nr:DUF3168 domain-containing protein [Duganella flavida]MYM25780.1 DUF3168 domain-containing protein [Duganella flavida]
MSLESMIFAAVRGIVDSRAFPDVAPEKAQPPYLTYQAVGGDAVNYVEATIPEKQNSRVQISVWAETRLAASDIGKQVEDALRTYLPLQATVLTARRSMHDPETQLRGSMQDFSFWY